METSIFDRAVNAKKELLEEYIINRNGSSRCVSDIISLGILLRLGDISDSLSSIAGTLNDMAHSSMFPDGFSEIAGAIEASNCFDEASEIVKSVDALTEVINNK